MLQTASSRLYGRLAMCELTRPDTDAATRLLCTGSGLENLSEAAWHSAHHIGYKACWKELPLALRPCDDSEPEIFALRLAGLSPKTSSDLSVFCYQEVGGDEVLSFLSENGQLMLYGRPGTFPVGEAWDSSDSVHCGETCIEPVSGMAFFGAAASMAHSEDLREEAPCLL